MMIAGMPHIGLIGPPASSFSTLGLKTSGFDAPKVGAVGVPAAARAKVGTAVDMQGAAKKLSADTITLTNAKAAASRAATTFTTNHSIQAMFQNAELAAMKQVESTMASVSKASMSAAASFAKAAAAAG